MSITIGQQAPNFTLRDTEKNVVSLEDFKGKNVVILFFPLAFTGTCTKELCTIRDDISNYKNLGTDVVAISVDSLFSLLKFKQEQDLNFTLLSDFNKVASTTYDCLFETFPNDMNGVSKRAAFVVDKNGIIQYAEVLASAGDLPNFDAIKACVASL
ncbi:MAG: redoxin domain-containing protein [Bacteroidota bacterium]|nr:redoxin domain-containing protein [Bacteroidota bacterium]